MDVAEKKLESYKNEIIKQCGFCEDPYLPTWQNVGNYIGEMAPRTVHGTPN